MKLLKEIFATPFAKVYLSAQFFTRLIIAIYALWQNQVFFSDLPGVFISGAINDTVSLIYILPIIMVISSLGEISFLRKACWFVVSSFLVFNFVSELSFWDEFSTRYNFIAVDYLIYTQEIVGTVKESMPFVEIITAIIMVSAILAYFIQKRLISNLSRKEKLNLAFVSLILSVLAFKLYKPEQCYLSNNIYAQELGKNGPYEFVSAFRNNSLDYLKFYPSIAQTDATRIVRGLVRQENQTFLDDSIARHTKAASSEIRRNVVFVVVESLSAEYLGVFGNKNNITPNLDKVAKEGILFTNVYATGTRTVRGLEALTLGAPPIPGSSIIRRPNNDRLFNIGSVFKNHGYEISFIFGGFSYFDNLENYFSKNGYEILDRNNLKEDDISFANIWGVADEDILTKAINKFDSYNGKPFFSIVMTTSNHRPYTFPEGRIDLPSGAGRKAAVKYTDYAIGKFINEARKKPWFKDTVFVIIADHCASSAGKTNLPIEKYHIPLIIYSPGFVAPKIISNLSSQIDVLPTVLGLLNFDYDSKFMGRDILNFPANRAFIGTYQLLGYLKNDRLVVLSPKSAPEIHETSNEDQPIISDPNNILIDEAKSFYQTTYDMFSTGKMQN
ncbi:MAG: sulfatase-like hydrolase/transferase [Rickettsiaceae bacterium]|nr:sulfatase-like hydrolase/transferase [Rickettsiaceae bacterium]